MLLNYFNKTIRCEFAKEFHFDVKAQYNKSTRDRRLIKLLKLPAVMASGISTIILSSEPNELCDTFLLQEKQAGNKSNKIIEEIIPIVDRLLDYNNITKNYHKYYHLFKLNENYEVDRRSSNTKFKIIEK